MPENAGQMQVLGQFQKGQSGNPKGRAKGTKNRATLAAEQLLESDLDNICRKLIEEALTGNMQAIKLVLDRVLPQKRDRIIDVKLPKLQTTDDAVNAMSLIIDSIGSGNITPGEGEALSRVVDAFVKAIQAYDLEKRVGMLEHGVKE
jgi:predicted ATPase